MRYLSQSLRSALPLRFSFPLLGVSLAFINGDTPLLAQAPTTVAVATTSTSSISPQNQAAHAMAIRYFGLSTSFLHDREFALRAESADSNAALAPQIQRTDEKSAAVLWHLNWTSNAKLVSPARVVASQQLRSVTPAFPVNAAPIAISSPKTAAVASILPLKTMVATTRTAPKLSRVESGSTSAIAAPHNAQRQGSTVALDTRSIRLNATRSFINAQRVARPQATARPLRLATRVLTAPMLLSRESNAPTVETRAIKPVSSQPKPIVHIVPKPSTNSAAIASATIAPQIAAPKLASLPRIEIGVQSQQTTKTPERFPSRAGTSTNTVTATFDRNTKNSRTLAEAKARDNDRILLAQLDAELTGAKRRLKSARADLSEGARDLGMFTNTLQSAMFEAGPDAAGLHPFVRTAQRYAGTPYVWGGESARGFDCSGFIIRVMRDLGYRALPHSAAEQFNYGTPVAKVLLKPGDLVFFANTYKPGISHVGIWLGKGRFIHAAGTGKGTIVSYLSASPYAQKYAGARRLISKR